jgi:hypothetical protein
MAIFRQCTYSIAHYRGENNYSMAIPWPLVWIGFPAHNIQPRRCGTPIDDTSKVPTHS